ncbi:DUF5916 domain-containing protein [Rhodohalobacter sp.]|uniref:DUF5916 domain-containing protein n=1 Tax=Rhodohalobacter sp. TaxID=1974210 RepID=UPI002ACD7E20|nr:DUF5916 domain-containing protein [Rhodohalobacter sp.]MDZ7756733.1 DUF5916 domain-containing protein [Rhodohalobacter sp.]
MEIFTTRKITILLSLLGILIGAEAGFSFENDKALKIAQGNEELSDSIKIDKTADFQLKAHRVEQGTVIIDGTMTETGWGKANMATGFTQHTPNTGEPASQKTEVCFLYDDDYLYIGARMYDDNPDQIAATLFRRDGNEYSDWLFVGIDSYNDNRTAFVFGVNPRGVRKDFLIYNDDREDTSWDAVWEASASVDDEGWTAELRIPLSQIRYNGEVGEIKSWGINFSREIARNGETSFWAPTLPDDSGLVSHFGRVNSLRELPEKNRLEVLPYLSGQLDRSPGDSHNPFYQQNDLSFNLGGDIKYGLSSNMTLTATINPDFAQVEVDPADVNLTAFETFFPERRPFFLEGSEIFSFGFNSNINIGHTPQLFYSRRIGRAPQGSVPGNPEFENRPSHTPIAGAVKFSGKTSDGWSFGLMNALTLEQNAHFSENGSDISSVAVEPFSNYMVGRVKRDFREGNTVVGMMANSLYRDLSAPTLESRLTDRAFSSGIDFEHSWRDRQYRLNGRFAGSHVSGEPEVIERLQQSSARYFQRPDADHLDMDASLQSLQGVYVDVMFTSQTRHWMSQFRAYQISPGFEVNDMGFQSDADRRAVTGMLIHMQPSPVGILENFNVWAATANSWNTDGDYIRNIHGTGGYFRFQNFWSVNYQVLGDFRSLDDRLTRGGPIAQSPASIKYSLNVNTDSRKDFRVSVRSNQSRTEMGEWSHYYGISLRYRPHPAASISLEPSLSKNFNKTQYITAISDPNATTTYGSRYVFSELEQTTLATAIRLDWTFTPDISLQMFAQPFVSVGSFDRFKELRRPESMDYAVYGDDTGSVSYDEATRRYEIDPDGSGDATFDFGNPDFNFRSLRGNAVIRWEFRPGSTLFFVWQQNRTSRESIGSLNMGHDYGELLRTPADHTLLVKFSYWLGY